MSVVIAEIVENPYASPSVESRSTPITATPVTKPGSLAIILAGFVLLLAGYFTSNLFLIADLYHIGFGPNGKVIASPLAAAFNTPAQQWMLYVAFAAAFIAGAVMIGSQRFNPMAVVCFVMCPLAGGVYLIASPLRIAQKHAEPVAALYLLVGSCLFCTGATRMFLLYGQNTNGFAPVAASMMTEVGLALVVGSAVKFWHVPAAAIESMSDIVVAEINDGAVRA